MTKKIIKIGLSTLMIGLAFNGCNKKVDNSAFLNQIENIDNEMHKSALNAPDLKVNIADLPKTVIIDKKEYQVDYMQQFLTIKNFNDKKYCDKKFSRVTSESNPVNVLGTSEVLTKCENNDMLIIYNKLGKQ